MIPVGSSDVLAVFLIFCRVGSCLMIAPGFSSSRIPARIRLFVAISASLALSPILADGIAAGINGQQSSENLRWIAAETLTGAFIGLISRLFYLALQTMMTAVAMAAGYGSIPGTPVDDAEAVPAMTSLLMMLSTALLFLMDLHLELLKGILDSYSRIPAGTWVGAQSALVQVIDQVTSAFLVSFRISGPFVVYSVIVNLAVAITNKLTPQIPVFFIMTPLVMLGSLLLLYTIADEMILMFMSAFNVWLVRG